jgi:hypothetical protein
MNDVTIFNNYVTVYHLKGINFVCNKCILKK